MEKLPLISIIVPVFKVEQYLRRCVDSILAQTYTNIEVILIDDGSPDGCPAICDEYAMKDSRVVVIHQKNAGVSAARNAGLDVAKGDYIGFVDSDDWIEPDMYEKLYFSINSNNVELVMCGFYDYDGTEKKIKQEPLYSGEYNKTSIYENIILPMVGTPTSAPKCAPIMGTLWRCLFKTDIIKKEPVIYLKNVKIAEDLLFDIEYLCRCNSVAVIEDALYNYRKNMDSATNNYITKLYEHISAQMEYMKNALQDAGLFNEKTREYYSSTLLYNITWCITNECKRSNPANKSVIIKRIREYRNKKEYKEVLKFNIIKNIGIPEQCYFGLIKLRLYHFILWFNRR